MTCLLSVAKLNLPTKTLLARAFLISREVNALQTRFVKYLRCDQRQKIPLYTLSSFIPYKRPSFDLFMLLNGKNSNHICLYAYSISVYVELFIDLHLSIHMRVNVRVRTILLTFAFCSIICRKCILEESISRLKIHLLLAQSFDVI